MPLVGSKELFCSLPLKKLLCPGWVKTEAEYCCYMQPSSQPHHEETSISILFSSLPCCVAALPLPPATTASDQRDACETTRAHRSPASWPGGGASDFEHHCYQLKTILRSESDAAEVFKHWEKHLLGRIPQLKPATLDLPQCGQWLYLYITNQTVTPQQRSQSLVLAHAGHALAQRLVIVEQDTDCNFFSQPVLVQQLVAQLNQGCFSPLP